MILRIRNVTSLLEDCNLTLQAMVKHDLSYLVPHRFFAPQFKRKIWDGRVYYSKLRDNIVWFPTGLAGRVISTLQTVPEAFNTLQIVDERLKPDPVTAKSLEAPFKLWEGSQVEAFQAATNSGRGIIRLPTGGGKTIVLAALLGHYNQPSIVTTHQINILEHLKEDVERALGVEVGIIQGPQKVLHQFNIGTIQTLTNCLEQANTNKLASEVAEFLQTTARVWIADEAHHTASKTFTTFSNRLFNAYYRFGVSATPFREDGADMAIEAGLGRVIYSQTASDLIKQKRLAKPYIFFISYKYDKALAEGCPDCGNSNVLDQVRLYRRCTNKVDKKRCSSKFATIHSTTAQCPICSSSWDLEAFLETTAANKLTFGICSICHHEWKKGYGVRVKGIVRNDIRNHLIVRYACQRIRRRKSVLVSVQYREHCQKLYDAIRSEIKLPVVELAMGETLERTEILKRLERKETLCVVATNVFGEGVNIPSLDCLINTKASTSKTDVLQTVGRVLRRTTKKKKVIVIDFNDKFKKFSAKARIRKEILQEEPEFVVKEIDAKVV